MGGGNLYAYVKNNPINLWDLLGCFPSVGFLNCGWTQMGNYYANPEAPRTTQEQIYTQKTMAETLRNAQEVNVLNTLATIDEMVRDKMSTLNTVQLNAFLTQVNLSISSYAPDPFVNVVVPERDFSSRFDAILDGAGVATSEALPLPPCTEPEEAAPVGGQPSTQGLAEAGGLAPNNELRETAAAGGTVSLPTPTQDQINGVVAAWSRYGIRFQGSAANQQKMQTLFAQAVLFRRPNGSPSMAMREVVSVLLATGGAKITLGFGLGNETTRDHSGERSSFISIENYGSTGRPISAEQMVVSIMHEMLHATDRIRGMSYMEAVERHNEIYRIQNQTLYDLGLSLDPGPRGSQIPEGDKYIGPRRW